MQHSGFFISIAGDRRYQASDYAAYFSTLVSNGVFPVPGTGLGVITNNDMTVTVNSGKAWINGYIYHNDSELVLTCDPAESILDRIDRVVIRFSITDRSIVAVVKKGIPGSSPVAPTLQRDNDIYELGIADMFILHGSTMISQVVITDLRMNTTYCGWVNSLIQADTTSIFNQYQAWFNQLVITGQAQIDELESELQSDWDIWFADVQSQLSGDIAANLLLQIQAIPRVYRGSTDPVSTRAIDFWFKEV